LIRQNGGGDRGYRRRMAIGATLRVRTAVGKHQGLRRVRRARSFMAEKSEKDVAQGQLAKLQKANDAKQAVADYEAEAAAMRAKTARLRELRLAREAELAATRPPAPVRKAAGKKKASAKSVGTLADWIKSREDGGHNN
jgi:hypothetical protein